MTYYLPLDIRRSQRTSIRTTQQSPNTRQRCMQCAWEVGPFPDRGKKPQPRTPQARTGSIPGRIRSYAPYTDDSSEQLTPNASINRYHIDSDRSYIDMGSMVVGPGGLDRPSACAYRLP
jgi:hypothetical protein